MHFQLRGPNYERFGNSTPEALQPGISEKPALTVPLINCVLRCILLPSKEHEMIRSNNYKVTAIHFVNYLATTAFSAVSERISVLESSKILESHPKPSELTCKTNVTLQIFQVDLTLRTKTLKDR